MSYDDQNEACGRFIQKMKKKYGENWSPYSARYAYGVDLPKGKQEDLSRFRKPDMRPKSIVEPEKVLDENGWKNE